MTEAVRYHAWQFEQRTSTWWPDYREEPGHDTRAGAEAEAVALAKANPGKTWRVVAILGEATAPLAPAVLTTFTNKDVPCNCDDRGADAQCPKHSS